MRARASIVFAFSAAFACAGATLPSRVAGAAPAASPSPAPSVASSATPLPAGASSLDTNVVPSAAIPSPLPMPANCGVDEGMSIAQAFGREVADAPTLRFIALVEHRSDRADLASARSVPDIDAVARVRAASLAACTGAVASVAAARAFLFVTVGTAPNFARGEQNALLVRLADAAAALSTPDVASADADAVLAPFGTTRAALAAPDPAPSGAPCVLPDRPARVVEKIDPPYPAAASRSLAQGRVRVTIVLDPSGFGRYATLHDTNVEESTLVDAATYGALASTYEAARRRCVSRPSAYLFVASFVARPFP